MKAANQEVLQEALSLHIAAGGKSTTFADERGIALRSIQRWLGEPKVKARVRQLRQEATDQAVGKLVDATDQAVNTIKELSKSGTSEATKLQASRAILTHSMELSHFVDHEERLLAIEAQLAALAIEKEEGVQAYPYRVGKKSRLD